MNAIRPAWQTEELADEWPDEEEEQSAELHDHTHHSDGEEDSFVVEPDEGDISFTAPLPSHIHTTPSPYASPGRAAFGTSVALRASLRTSRSTSYAADFATAPASPAGSILAHSSGGESPRPAGTFVVRDDVPDAPLPFAQKNPFGGKNKVKDIFAPLPLERMFEPPSPPVQAPEIRASPIPEETAEHSRQDDHIQNAENPNSPTNHASGANNALAPPPMSRTPSPHPFTFTCSSGKGPLAQSTPFSAQPHMPAGASHAPSSSNAAVHQTPARRDTGQGRLSIQTTPLRLFGTQYDTYTRDHLSALADSIAVAPSSGASDGSSPRVGSASLSPFPDSGDHTQDRHPFGLSPITSSSTGFSQGDVVSPPASAKDEADGRIPDLRAIKRVRLSPASDYGDEDGNVRMLRTDASYGEGAGAGASISRPRAAATPARGFIHSPALEKPGAAVKGHRPSPLAIGHLSSHNSVNRRSLNGRGSYRPSPLSSHVMVNSPSPSKGRGSQQEPTSPVLRSSVNVRPSGSDPRLPRLAVPDAVARVSRTPSPAQNSSTQSSPQKKLQGADYLQESRSLMQQIAMQQKEHNFSTISSTRSGPGGTSFVGAGQERSARSSVGPAGREHTEGSVVIHDDEAPKEEPNQAQRPAYQTGTTTAYYLQRANSAMAALKDELTVSSIDTATHSRRESLATHSRNPSDATNTGRQDLAESMTQRSHASAGVTTHARTKTGMTGTTLGSSLRKSSSNALASSSSRPRVPSTRRVASASTQRTVSGSSDATALDHGPSNKPPSFSSSLRSSFSRVPSDNAPPSLGSAPSDATVADPVQQTGGTMTREDMRRFVSAASTNGTAATIESGVKHGSFGNVTGAAQPRRGFIPAQGYTTNQLAPQDGQAAPTGPVDPRTAAMGVLAPSPVHPTIAGPRAGRRITTIAPSDLGMPIPERVGTMVFDHATGRWVRQGNDASDDTTDVFGDIDSLQSGENASTSGLTQSVSSTSSRSLALPDASGYAGQEELLNSHLPDSSYVDEEYEPMDDLDIDISSDPPTGHVVPIMTGHMSFIEEEDGDYIDYSYIVQHPHDMAGPEQEGRFSSFTSSSDSDVDDVTNTDRPYLEQQRQLEHFRARSRSADESSDSIDGGDEPYAHVEEIMDDEGDFEDELPDEEEDDDDDTERPHLYAPRPDHLQPKIEEASPAGLGSLIPPPSSHLGSSPMSQSPSVGTLRSALKSNPLNSGAQASQPSSARYAARDRRPHRRSVSFSDGRLDGPIVGLSDSASSADTNDQAVEDEDEEDGNDNDGTWIEKSVRTQRIEEMMRGLALDESDTGEPDVPTRSRSFQRTISSAALAFNGDDADASSGPRHSFSRAGPDASSSHSMRVTSVVLDVSPSAFPMPPGAPQGVGERILATQNNTPNVTRGTTMSAYPSFSLARSALIRALTDVVPFIPYWDTLREVDLTVLGAPEEETGPTTGAPRDGSGAAGMDAKRQQAAREERDEDDTGSSARDGDMSLAASGEVRHGRRGQKLESLVGLEDCCPVLVGVRVANNALTYLTGLPRTVLRLDAAHNLLSETTSFGECCARVEALDVRGNRLTGGAENLAPLHALRTLDASRNRLTSVAGVQRLRNLVRLDLHGNRIEGRVQAGDWPKLEYLNLSNNKITSLEGLDRVPALVVLDLDNNDLGDVVLPPAALARLRILRLSGNARVRRVEGVERLPALRVFYADGCRMEVGALVGASSGSNRADAGAGEIDGSSLSLRRASRLSDLDLRRSGSSASVAAPELSASTGAARRWPARLENLSLRNQCRERGAARKRRDAVDLLALTSDVRDVKRLYLSGNALSYSPASRAVPCYSLVYLELAACRLTALPDAFAGLFPNVRVLNLNYNFLEDREAAKLRGLVRLRRLSMVGGRVGDAKVLVGIVSGMHEVESVDFRMHPCTLGWYLPLLVKDVPGALSPSGAGEWAEMDAKFRRDLPDEAYIGRLAYRGLMMQRCGQLRTLDGVGVTEKEVRKAGRLLSAVRGAGPAAGGAASAASA
ncbi:hypothetical protein HDZ31DRAFT_64432 [Schizophyllum fasciatum]